jgi:hypothetical protein
MSSNHRHEKLVQIWTGRRVRFVLAAMLLCQTYAHGQSGPPESCEQE